MLEQVIKTSFEKLLVNFLEIFPPSLITSSRYFPAFNRKFISNLLTSINQPNFFLGRIIEGYLQHENSPLPKVKLSAAAITLRLVGKRSTMTQYTVLMPSDVSASNMHESMRFSVEFLAKYNPHVAPPATIRLKTVSR